jgi:hypothetical protein
MEVIMEHYTYDKKNGLWYKLEGDYYVPCVTVPEVKLTGIWGERRRRFLRTHHRPIYDTMLMSGTLKAHLEEVDRSAEEMLDRHMSQIAEYEGATEHLKAENQLEWIRRMNSIRHRAEEIVRKDLIEN